METLSNEVKSIFQKYEKLVTRRNESIEYGNGIFTRYKY